MYDNFASIVTEDIFIVIVSVTILLVLPVFLTSISFTSLDGIVLPTNLQARYDLFCVKSAVKPQPTNQMV